MKTLSSLMPVTFFILFLSSANTLGIEKSLSEDDVNKIVKEYVIAESTNHQFFFNTAIAILGALVVVSGIGMFKLMLDEHRLRKESETILNKAKNELNDKIVKIEDAHRKRVETMTKKYDASLKEELEGFRHRAILYSFSSTSANHDDAIFPAITYLEGRGTIKDLSLLRDIMKNKNISTETRERVENAVLLVSTRR